MGKIKEMMLNDRPIERLLNLGSEALSNEELLAIILKTGTKGKSSKDIASNLLSKIENISNLKSINLETLIKTEGIGIIKGVTILAVIELGNRINKKIENINNLKITSSEIVFDYYKNIIGDKLQEYFYCLYLDNSKKVIKEKLLYIGTINYSLVHPREVFKEAFLLSASSIICIHNHPSGNIIPSKPDIETTDKLVEIGHLTGIEIVDHIIISKNKYYSFFENDLIK